MCGGGRVRTIQERNGTRNPSATPSRTPCGSSGARAGAGPGTFLRMPVLPERGGAAVADLPAGEAGRDRRQGGGPRPLRHLPDGGGRGVASAVRGGAVAHWPAIGGRRGQLCESGSRRPENKATKRVSLDVERRRTQARRAQRIGGSLRRRLASNWVATWSAMGGPCLRAPGIGEMVGSSLGAFDGRGNVGPQ